MAVFAFVVGVLTQQRERRQIVVEEQRVLPFRFGVTGRAFGAYRTLMWVVIEMAGVTARGWFDLENGFYVAIITRNGQMTSAKHVFGISIVIEGDHLPIIGNVAGVAAVAEVVIVIVVFEVT